MRRENKAEEAARSQNALRRFKSACRKVISAGRIFFLCVRGALWRFVEIKSIPVPAPDKIALYSIEMNPFTRKHSVNTRF